jgi:hypothetical protein
MIICSRQATMFCQIIFQISYHIFCIIIFQISVLIH